MEHLGEPFLNKEVKDKPKATEGSSEHWTYKPPEKPAYLGFLRFFGGLNLVIGIIAVLVFAFSVLREFNKARYEDSSLVWLVALAITLEGFLAFGLFYAIADIAENMIVVGRYVKSLKEKVSDTNQDIELKQ